MKNERIYCALPWYTLQLHLDGSYGPCCHLKIPNDAIPDNVSALMGLFNSNPMQRIRQALIDGNPIGLPCQGCYDRYFDTDHDIFGMGRHLPRYSLHGNDFDERHSVADQAYIDGDLVLSQPPLELYCYTSEACNLKCTVCVQNQNYALFPVEKIIAIIQEVGWANIDRFGFVGGEPLLTQDALTLLSFICEQQPTGTCIYITTNGTLIHKHIDKLDKIDNLFLTISIEGFGSVYEKLRVNAKWDRLLSNLMLLKAHHRDHPRWRFNIYSIVMNSTLPHLLDVLKLAQLMDATIFYNREVTGNKTENFFVHADGRPLEEINRALDRAIDYAVKVDAVKATDSLRKLRTYLYDCRSALRQRRIHIENQLGKLADRPFVIYGAGGHTDRLFQQYNLDTMDLRAVVDSDPRKWGRSLCGKTIISPSDIKTHASTVLISSEEYEAEIYRLLVSQFNDELELITLYT